MFVSILLPVYNGEKYLEEALISLSAQSYEDFEIIAVDDASNDDSAVILQEFARREPRLVVLQNDIRLGLFANYNECLSKAQGKLIKPFAQDDLLSSTTLEEMVSAMKRHDRVAMVACGKLASGKDVASLEQGLSPGINSGKSAILNCLSSYRNLIGEPVAVMFRKEFCGSGFDTTYNSLGDLEFWIRILEQGDLFVNQEQLVSFRQHDDSATNQMLRNMTWLFDFPRLAKQYPHYLSQLGTTYDEYMLGFVEKAAVFIEHCAGENPQGEGDFTDFQEIAWFALRRLGQTSVKGSLYESMLESTSWRITKPIREIKKLMS